MKISIFGLGYVGSVCAGCLARDGHDVIGVDPIRTKVDLINAGGSPVIEQDLGTIIGRAIGEGRLRAVTDAAEGISGSEISMICVGTPTLPQNGGPDLKHVEAVCRQMGAALARKKGFHIVVMRSTVLPGTMRGTIIPALESASGLKAGRDFGVLSNPEFLREGTGVSDYYNPPKIVIGEMDARCGDILAGIYSGIDAPLIRTAIEVAEMVKYVDNAWHALKIGFANEIGNLCKAMGVDSHSVMDIFCQDRKLNLSPVYLKPGFAFGGSCLPKDLRSLSYKGRNLGLELPILEAILPSNARQIERGIQLVISNANGIRKIGVLGFSFKAGTDDLRESPLVELIERLIGKGYDLRLYDRNVDLARLVGANKDYILNHIPHISRLMVGSVSEVIDHAGLVVLGNNDPEFDSVAGLLRAGQVLVDLVRAKNIRVAVGRYDGICW